MLLNAAKYLAKEYGFAPVYLDEPMFPDPVIPASQSGLFEALHILLCAETGADPAYISTRHVVNWVVQKSMAAHG